jgi:hypothetical protein
VPVLVRDAVKGTALLNGLGVLPAIRKVATGIFIRGRIICGGMAGAVPVFNMSGDMI